MVVTIYEKAIDIGTCGPRTVIRDVDKFVQTDTGVFKLVLDDSIIFIPSQYMVVVTELED